MNTVATGAPPIPNDSTKRMLVMLSAGLLPISFAILLTCLFYLVGDYQVVERVPAKTEYASITFPERGKAVDTKFTARGRIIKLPENSVAYLMAKRNGLYWPKKYLGKSPGEWSEDLNEVKEKSNRLSLVVLAMAPDGKEIIDQWYATTQKTGEYPGISLFDSAREIALVEVKQK